MYFKQFAAILAAFVICSSQICSVSSAPVTAARFESMAEAIILSGDQTGPVVGPQDRSAEASPEATPVEDDDFEPDASPEESPEESVDPESDA